MGMILTVWRVFLGFDFSTHSPLVEEKGESLPPLSLSFNARDGGGGIGCETHLSRRVVGTHRRAYSTRPFLGAKMAIEVTALAAAATSLLIPPLRLHRCLVTGVARPDDTWRAAQPVDAFFLHSNNNR